MFDKYLLSDEAKYNLYSSTENDKTESRWPLSIPIDRGVHPQSLPSCPTLCDPVDSSLPGSSNHGDSPGKNTGVGCHALLQGIFPTQGSNPCLLCLLHWQVPMCQCATSATWEALLIEGAIATRSRFSFLREQAFLHLNTWAPGSHVWAL